MTPRPLEDASASANSFGRYSWLAIALMLLAAAYPSMSFGWAGYLLWIAVFWLVIGGCLRVVSVHPRLRVLAMVIGGTAVVTSAAGLWQTGSGGDLAFVDHGSIFVLLARMSALAFLAIVTATTLRDVFDHADVTMQTLLGAACGYVLIGLTFAFALLVFQACGDSPIVPAGTSGVEPGFDTDPARQTARYLYFSFVTLSTLGYGDLIPVSPAGELVATGEAIVGQLYLAVFIARLVGMHVADRLDRRS